MKRAVLLLFFSIFLNLNMFSQIYAPEGLNMPGSWDSWTNPPENNVFASATQALGNIHLIPEMGHYQSIFSTPSDLAGGSFEFLFTSGPSENIWANKWADVTVELNTIQSYTYYNNGGTNNSIMLNDNKYYVVNWEDNGYADTRAVFMELDAEPVSLINVSQDISTPEATQDVTVNLTTSAQPSEHIYIRYSTDNWQTSSLATCAFSGTSGEAVIPAQAEGSTVKYYVFSTGISNPTTDYNLITINFDNNNGQYYSYNVQELLSCDEASGVLSTNPVFPLQEGTVTISFDASSGNGELFNYKGDIYAHTGLITSESDGNNDWVHVKSEWGENLAELKFSRNLPDSNSYSLTINDIRSFYNVPLEEEIYKIAMVIRGANPINPQEPENFLVARNADGTDFHINVYNQGLNVKYVGKLNKDPLVPLNALIPVCIYSMDANNISLKIDDIEVEQTTSSELMFALNTGNYSEGTHEIIATASDGTNFAYDTTYFYIRGAVSIEELPAGVHPGINYVNDNMLTLVLPDPANAKEYAFVIGDFNDWLANDDSYMKKTPDGKYFWVNISNLMPGVEYTYQYYIDGNLKIADPYCEKILDPWNDRHIPESTYPNLKKYPWDKTIGTVSVLETGQTPYNWQVEDFTPLAINETQSNLIIYELLIRDFTKTRALKNITDTLDYLVSLGVNAIELMPIAEFDGNDSWGYAPNFYYAPDKAYGTKNDYKAFIDACHQKGIAVILDVVYNHMYGGSPFVQMYWDSENNMPATNNPWFNQQAPHPYSIGYDFNHESPETKKLIKDNLNYWMSEYKIDGFRFDLSKGFTQTFSGNDIGLWSQFDPSRIAIIQDYYNYIKSIKPNAYVIFEHFAENNEEQALAGSGCLLWGVMNEEFSQTAEGYDTNCDISQASYKERGFAYPNLIPFMESHDEERIAYNCNTFGNGFAGDTSQTLKRLQAAAAVYMSIVGPKMIWQFGEIGYDESIRLCPDSSYSEDCRTSAKPVHWEYMNDINRQKLYWTYAAMAKLKTENAVFLNGDNYGQDISGLGKRLWYSSPELNISTTANFTSFEIDMEPAFQHTGTWYNYFTGETYEVNDLNQSIHYNPGDFYVFTDVPKQKPFIKLTFKVKDANGNNIENAQIQIEEYASSKTDNMGSAHFLYGTAKALNYTVSAAGYFDVSGSLTTEISDLTELVLMQKNTAVNETKLPSIKIYPNPANTHISFSCDSDCHLSIIDLNGKTVSKQKLKKGKHSINIKQLKTGIYFLKISSLNTTKMARFIKIE